MKKKIQDTRQRQKNKDTKGYFRYIKNILMHVLTEYILGEYEMKWVLRVLGGWEYNFFTNK